jgi:hypothetical protein
LGGPDRILATFEPRDVAVPCRGSIERWALAYRG